MNVFGLTITRQKAAVGSMGSESALYSGRGWWPIIRESFAGAWQRNVTITTENVLTFAAVYACVTLIATDVAKLRVRLVDQDGDGIWNDVERDSPFWPVLRKPNRYQTRIQFFQRWMLSKLIHGNAYLLKQRDRRGIVVAMYVLDPLRVRPMVAPDGAVFYAIGQDALAQVSTAQTVVPASEIIHDRMPELYHDLCGISPITACGLAATQGLKAQEHSAHFFENGAQPGGLLVVPTPINDEQAAALKRQWEEGFSGDNYGRVAVLGNGLTYQPLNMVSAVDAQFIEQLKLSAEMVCTAFKVPPYKVNVGPPPAYNNVEALDQQYYGQCLQIHIESIELLLDEGLGLVDAKTERPIGTEFELDDLMRMDSATLVATLESGKNIYTPNEQRKRLNLSPVTGGDDVLRQQQDFSLQALAKRDAQDDPFGASTPKPTETAPLPDDDDSDADDGGSDEERSVDVGLLIGAMLEREMKALAA